MKNTCAVVLAAGKGTRMESDSPKVLRKLAGKPMLFYTLEKLEKAGIPKIVVVIGYKGENVKAAIRKGIPFFEKISFANQPNQKGTGDAVKWGIKGIKAKKVVVVNGDDSAFYNAETVSKILERHKSDKATITFVSLRKDDPAGLGRVVRDKKGRVKDIVEEKDANSRQKKIKEVNAGFYVFYLPWLRENVKKIKLSRQGEYYIVDLVRMAVDKREKVSLYRLGNDDEWRGVNTKKELEKADEEMRKRVVSN